MIKAAIFDIDGTLIDSMAIWDELGARYLRGLSIEPEKDLGKILYPMTIAEGVRYLKTRYELPETEEEIRAGLNSIVERFYREEVQLKDGAAELLKHFRADNIPMMLATIGEPELENAALVRLGVRDYFMGMLNCEDLNTSKKEPLIYLKAAGRMHTKPEETLVFEDVYQAVRSAKAAGFKVCAIRDDASRADWEKMEREADWVIGDFTAFAYPAMIRKL